MNDAPHEIVIIRRRYDNDHDEAHGGVWKVAFADFMTAMMAFFLVLWIVNSTSKETRTSVARYFNPVRLSDTTPARKGLQEPREEDFDARAVEAGKKPAAPTPPDKTPLDKTTPPPSGSQAPRAVADEPSAAAPVRATVHLPSANDAGEQFRDPFASAVPTRETSVRDAATKSLSAANPDAGSDAAVRASRSADAAVLSRAVVALAGKSSASGGPAVEVRETPEGTLISLTDRADFGMFAIGSADPNAALVRLVTELGNVLRPSHAQIIIRGHTDARKFRKTGFDNWRLSAVRAQSAAEMLVRGGVDERRIDRIEGYADHTLRNTGDPEAAENRRVEILLRKEGA